MQNEKSLSIIIPVLNTGIFFPELINSLKQQTGDFFEIWEVDAIFIDDASDDPVTIEALKSLPPYIGPIRTKILQNQARKGISATRNIGIIASFAKWIAFLDSDDILLPQGINSRLAAITRTPAARFISGDLYYWQVKNKEAYPGVLRYQNSELISSLNSEEKIIENSFEAFFKTLPVHTNTVMIHRDVLNNIGFFDETLRRCEDTDLWLRTALATNLLYVHSPISVYRRHALGITQSRENEAVYMLKVVEKLSKLPISNTQRKCINQKWHELLLNSCYYHAELGEPAVTIDYWLQAVRRNKLSTQNLIYTKQVVKALVKKYLNVGSK